jgi:hypothetical protein
MKRKVCTILALAALLLVYSMNAVVAWATLSTMFVVVMTKRHRLFSGSPGQGAPCVVPAGNGAGRTGIEADPMTD